MAAYKDQKYFNLLEKGAGYALKAARFFKQMTEGTAAGEQAAAIKDVKEEGDNLIHIMLGYLQAAFITPIDRDDIYKIAKKTGCITGNIDTAADKMWIMNVRRSNAHIKAMADNIVNACEELAILMSELKNFKRKNKIGEKAAKISGIKKAGDKRCSDAIRELFISERDPIELLKMKEIYEGLKSVINSCEEAADCVQTILATRT